MPRFGTGRDGHTHHAHHRSKPCRPVTNRSDVLTGGSVAHTACRRGGSVEWDEVSAANRATPDESKSLPSREVGGNFCRSEGPIIYGDLVELSFQREHAVVAAAEEHLADVTRAAWLRRSGNLRFDLSIEVDAHFQTVTRTWQRGTTCASRAEFCPRAASCARCRCRKTAFRSVPAGACHQCPSGPPERLLQHPRRARRGSR